MNTKNKTKNTGASTTVLALKKEQLFSITATEKGARIRLVNNAPQQESQQGLEIRRVRGD